MDSTLSIQELKDRISFLESKSKLYEEDSDENCSTFKAIIEKHTRPVCVCDIKFNIVYINEAFRKLFKLESNHMLEKRMIDLISKESAIIFETEGLLALKKKGTWEEVLRSAKFNNKTIPLYERIEAIKNKNGKTEYYVCFLEDYTKKIKEDEELKQKNKELETLTEELTESSEILQNLYNSLSEKEAYLQSIFKAAPVGIGVVINRVIQFVNNQVTQICGYSKDELLGKNARMIYPTKAEYERVGRDKYDQISKKGIGTIETVWKCKDGSIKDILLSSCPFDINHPEKGVTFSALDITKRKTAEKKLNEEKEYTATLTETSPIGILSMDKDGIINYVNPKASSIFELPAHKMINKFFNDFEWTTSEYDGSPLAKEKASYFVIKKTKKPIYNDQKMFNWPSGKKKYLNLNSSPLFNDKKEFNGLIVSIEDITEKEKFIEQLKESEDKFSKAFLYGPDNLIITRLKDGTIINANNQFFKSTRNKKEDIIGKTTEEINFWKDQKERNDFITLLRKQGHIENFEKYYKHKDGRISFYLVSSHIIEIDGDKCLISILKDISDRKEWENKLKQAADIFNNIKNGLHIYHLEDINDDKTLRMVSANPASEALTGAKAEDIIGKTLDENFPGHREKDIPQTYAEVVRSQKAVELEDIYYGDGQVITGAFSLKAFPMPNNHIGVSFENITERIQSIENLKASESKLKEAQEVAKLGSYTLNLVNGVWTSSDTLNEIFGIDGTYTMNVQNWRDIVHPEHHEIMLNYFNQEVIEKKQPFNKEFKIITRDKKKQKWVHGLGRLEFDNKGNPISMIGTIQDITKRKTAEIALQQSEENLRNLYNTIDEFVFVLDKKGNIISVNDTVTKRLGYKPEELIGQNVIIVHPETRHKEAKTILSNIIKGSETTCNIPLQTKKGKLISVETNMSQGTWNGELSYFSVSKDITELLLSEERFNKAFQTTSHAMTLTDIEKGQIVEINESFEKIFGYGREEMIGLRRNKFDLLIDKDQRKNIREEILKKGSISNFDVKVKCKDGTIRCGIFSATIVEIQKKKYLLTSLNDITRRIQAENDLKESIRRFDDMLENVQLVAIMLDLEGNITFINDHLLRITGWKREQVLGKNWFEYFIPPDINLDKLFADKVPDGSFAHYFENEILTKKGERRLIGWNNTMLRDPDGKVIGTSSIGEDITEKKKAIEDLNRIFNFTADLICIADIEGRFLKVNPAFEKILGYKIDEILNRPIYDFIHPDDIDSTKAVVSESIKKKVKLIRHENRYVCKDGSYKWIAWLTQTMMDEGISFSIARDITRQKESEKELIEAKEKAEESDRLKSVFLANMSHEIRTPMNGIMGFSELLKSPEKSDEQKEKYVDIIWRNSNQLLHIINDLLDISKIEAEQLKIVLHDSNFNKTLDNLYEFFFSEIRSLSKELKLILKKPLPDEESIMRTDASRFEQILSNFLSNAIKFTVSGTIEFGYKSPSDNQIEFYVKDTGIGIPKEKQHVIFERFTQATDDTTQIYGGTGLGLSIAKGLAELLGGEIKLKSKFGKGSTFSLVLPYKTTKKRPSTKKENLKKDYDWSDKLILIVDDDPVSIELLKESLDKTSVRIISTEYGLEAVDICMNNDTIDTVLMDIRLPDIDGYEATRTIKNFRPNLPIIAQTAYAMPEDREKSLLAGCDDFIAKPIVQDKLLKIIDDYI